ncbi:hypothetical protein [Streptomyces kronopolitis]|uniref:hypothetical protein n=1 Tax=Streptomyces kronopolitis TaxID=1612435 RepID=UPI003D95D45E
MTCSTPLFSRDASTPTASASRPTHATLPLRIFNYAEKAVFERGGDEVTRQCRGLVIDHQGRILARIRRAVKTQ